MRTSLLAMIVAFGTTITIPALAHEAAQPSQKMQPGQQMQELAQQPSEPSQKMQSGQQMEDPDKGIKTSPTKEVEMAPMDVGTKTPDYEVVSPTELKLATGVKLQMLNGAGGQNKGAGGQNKGFVLLRPNGGLGGFMACGCVGAQTNSCITENDNPEHASCSGRCTDSEGNPHGCQLSGPIIGPPRDPYILRFSPKRSQ
ncbi:hypothetical protein ABIF66_006884 [Bradyrhizobium japonicum]